MNTSHYPSLDLCKKLTEAGFPETEKVWAKIFQFKKEDLEYDISDRYSDMLWECIWDYICPSIAELLDELPEWMIEFERIGKEWKIWYWYEDENPHIIYSINLPNALAEMYLWLKENNYLTK